MKKIAVVLCGCGFKDGSEIREAVGVLWALSQQQVQVQCFAPDALQAEVMNCLTMEPAAETRNMLVESARIARGNVRALKELHSSEWDGIVLPGGFGAAKNLCNFAAEGARAKVIPDLEKILVEMYKARKPIGAVCIAPAIVAIALKGAGIEFTVGAAGETAQEIEKLGHRHIPKKADEAHIDTKNRVISTPAYMWDDASLQAIFTGIQKMAQEVCRMA